LLMKSIEVYFEELVSAQNKLNGYIDELDKIPNADIPNHIGECTAVWQEEEVSHFLDIENEISALISDEIKYLRQIMDEIESAKIKIIRIESMNIATGITRLYK